MSITLDVCPICGEPAEYSDDHGPSLYCTHEPYRYVKPVEVHGRVENGELRFPLPDVEKWKVTVGAEMLAKQEEQARRREEWLALTCDERQARKVEARAKLSGATLAMYDMTEDMRRSMNRQLNTFTWGEPYVTTDPCAKCGDAGCENAMQREVPSMRGKPIRVTSNRA